MAERKVDDRFKKFGTVSFTSISKINDFVDYLEQEKVMGTKCKSCGLTFFPPRADCYKCLSNNMEWFEITGKGTLLSYSKLEYGPVGFEKDLPYTIAILDYEEFKVFGRLAPDLKESDVKVGMELKTVVNKMPNGQLNYVFQKT